MTKRFLALTLAMVMLLSLGGCGAKKAANLVMATGGTSGTYFALGGAMAGQVNSYLKDSGVKITATSTGASKENIRNIAAGEADLALVQNDVLDYASKGIELFDGEKTANLSVVATLYPEVVQIVVGKNSGINSIADLKGKKVSVGDVGSGVEANAKQILEAYGLTFDDVNASHLSFKESANGFKDKQLDAFFVTAGVPNTAVVELSVTDPVKVLEIDAEHRAALIKKYPFYGEFTVTKDVYNTDADATTLAVMATLIARKDLDEKVVYDITKALFAHLDELGNAHAKGKELSAEKAISSISIDMHAGAAKYFKEIGVLK
ncbi:MAG: TAXI family TRAP transporter solute-binding subunit [Angelakisella sp.]